MPTYKFHQTIATVAATIVCWHRAVAAYASPPARVPPVAPYAIDANVPPPIPDLAPAHSNISQVFYIDQLTILHLVPA